MSNSKGILLPKSVVEVRDNKVLFSVLNPTVKTVRKTLQWRHSKQLNLSLNLAAVRTQKAVQWKQAYQAYPTICKLVLWLTIVRATSLNSNANC